MYRPSSSRHFLFDSSSIIPTIGANARVSISQGANQYEVSLGVVPGVNVHTKIVFDVGP
jgi:hypothetical protein